MCIGEMDKPRIRVDFNELVAPDLVLLSQTDARIDSEGNEILFEIGKKVSIYEFNHYDDGTKEYLLAEGVAELNIPEINGEWSKAAKWCCRINEKGIKNEPT